MSYGTIKVDTITFTDNSVDKSVSLSGLIQNPTFTGNITVTGTISGDVIRGGTTVSGATVTGTTANFVSGVFTTQISGATVTGTTASFTSGVFTNISGTTATITSGIIASGTAAAPSLAILADLDTGLFSPGANELAVATNGVERVKFGTSEVVFNDGNNDYDFRVESDNNASLLFVDASTDRFGIGHSSPATLIHVADTLAGSPVIARIENFSTSANSDAALDLKTPNQNYTLKAVRSSARFDFETDGTPRLSITAAGLVGIGTSAPGEPLNVLGGGSTTSTVNFTGAGGVDNATIASDYSLFFQIDANNNIGGRVYTWSYGGKGYSDGTPLMTLDASGRLGIGTTSPDQLLVVSQNAASYNPAIKISNPNTGRWGGKLIFESANGASVYDAAVIKSDGGGGFGSGVLIVETAGSERCRVDGSGRLLVGTSTARSNVYIGASSATPLIQSETSGSTYNNGASLLTYSTVNYAPILTLGTSNSDTAGTNAAVGPEYVLGFINFVGNDGTDFRSGAYVSAAVDGSVSTGDLPTRLTFSTTADGASSPTERMRITSTGQVRLAGAGITFNGDTAAANELDDYEEGTWTATLGTFTGTAPTTTVTATGQYTKIGRLVHVEVQFSNVSTAGASGDVKISGLPFSGSTGNPANGNCSAYLFDFPAGLTSLSFQVSDSNIAFYISGDNIAWGNLLYSAGSGRYLSIAASYIV
jgi:hypothetical protein